MRQQIASITEKSPLRTGLLVIFSLVVLAALLFWMNRPESNVDVELADLLRQTAVSPLDFGPVPDPAQVALGQALFFDKELSGNRDISCATCHHPLLWTGDGLALPLGTGGNGLGPTRIQGDGRAFVPRNAPEVFNRGAPEWRTMFWDGRVVAQDAKTLLTPAGAMSLTQINNVTAAQAMFPVTSVDEMRGHSGDKDVFGEPNELAQLADDNFAAIWDGLMARLLAIPDYQTLFQAAFPDKALDDLTFHDAANAMGAFEAAAFTFTDSPWDRYLSGDTDALTDEEKQGALLFYGAAGCVRCHAGSLMTDQQYHNIGAPHIGPGKNGFGLDNGRFLETDNPADQFAFRTPPLRNVALTGPWLHNGAYNSLEAVVRHHLGAANSLVAYDMRHLAPELQITCRGDAAMQETILQTLDPLMIAPPPLTDGEVEQIIAFLYALTAPSATNLAHILPESVPSGLPVRD